jgi:hypothetical protein
MADDRVPVTFSMSPDDLRFLIWAMRFLRGGPHNEEKAIDRWEATFAQALCKHFDELPLHAMDDDEEVDRQADPAPERSTAAATLTRRQVFFRFSTRQSMFLLVTLSICFAFNRHNHFDDFIFLLALVVNPYSVIILTILVGIGGWAVGRYVTPAGQTEPTGVAPGPLEDQSAPKAIVNSPPSALSAH